MKKADKQTSKPLSADLLRKMQAWWRTANYLSVGQTYLYDNPLLKEPLKKEHVKPCLVGGEGALATITLQLDATEHDGLRRSAGILHEALESLNLKLIEPSSMKAITS